MEQLRGRSGLKRLGRPVRPAAVAGAGAQPPLQRSPSTAFWTPCDPTAADHAPAAAAPPAPSAGLATPAAMGAAGAAQILPNPSKASAQRNA
eukprot:9232003-Pyramimonas_sp.AAC.1